MAYSSRVRAALESRASATNDFFGGWDESDVEFLSKWAVDPSELVGVPGVIVDWLGSRTEFANHAWMQIPGDRCVVIADLPVPDDQVHAEAIEYFALLKSIEMAQARGRSFTMFELGSSYAPWCVLAGLVCRRAGFEEIHLCAVEASEPTIARIHDHVKLNRLEAGSGLTWQIVHAAVSPSVGTLYFPRVDTRKDNGAQVTRAPSAYDYRGVRMKYDRVTATTIGELTASRPQIDFVHLDLQGAEETLLTDETFLACVDDRVSAMLLATQSRLIEGLALRELSQRGWRLVRERPTMFLQNDRTMDVNGWTTRDGAQFWVNGRRSSTN